MKSFWWFKEHSVAGMARPGFNGTHWFDLPVDIAILMGWIGQFSSGEIDRKSLDYHLEHYAPKVFKFYRETPESAAEKLKGFHSDEGLSALFEKLKSATGLIDSHQTQSDHFKVQFNQKLLVEELDKLKTKGIKKVVSLTEKQHGQAELKEYFDTYHFAIQDLTAPSFEQAKELATILKESDHSPVAIHCLAGIGRTSTMIIAAHLILGHKLDDLLATVAKQNPTYVLTGSQKDFIESVERKLR